MSHFTVAVITDELSIGKIDDLMEPYCEDPEDGEYLEFVNKDEEIKEAYENETVDMIKTPKGKLYFSWDNELKNVRKSSPETKDYGFPEGYEKINVSFKEKYATLKEFAEEYYGYEYNKKYKAFGYMANPNAKWDWYVVGGRWQGMLEVNASAEHLFGDVHTDGFDDPAEEATIVVDGAKIKDIQWDRMFAGCEKHAEENWEEAKANIKEEDALRAYFRYGIREDDTKESYVNRRTSFSTFAVLDDIGGEWHERGEMGWFGMSTDTAEEAEQWDKEYFDRFIKNANPDHYLIIVDCHI